MKLSEQSRLVTDDFRTYALRAQFLMLAQSLMQVTTVDDVLEMVASAYRSWDTGSMLAMRCREAADEIEEAGAYISHKYGV